MVLCQITLSSDWLKNPPAAFDKNGSYTNQAEIVAADKTRSLLAPICRVRAKLKLIYSQPHELCTIWSCRRDKSFIRSNLVNFGEVVHENADKDTDNPFLLSW
jgi:hypothetical protein